MTTLRCTLIVLAKAPLAGYAKTRLAPALGEAGAAALAARLLSHTLAQALAADLGPVDLCCAPSRLHPAFAAFARPGIEMFDQGDGDLGQRMQHAFARRLGPGSHALLIGSDAPALDAALLRRATLLLRTTDAVFVPALDGGYALIGLRRPAPGLFEGMTWSTASVMAETRRRLAAARLRHTELPAVADIDTPADLVHLPAGWQEHFPTEHFTTGTRPC